MTSQTPAPDSFRNGLRTGSQSGFRNGFEEALRTAAEIASRSPSSHNCQPWAVGWPTSPEARSTAARSLGDDPAGAPGPDAEYLVLALDRDRALTALAAHSAEMLLSCGAFWHLLTRALAGLGWHPDHERFAAGPTESLGASWPRSWSALCTVRLRRGPADPRGLAGLREVTAARHTNRAPYRTEPLDPETLDALAAPAGADSGGVTVTHLVTEAERTGFADFVARHGGRDFSHSAAWRETHSFVRPTPAEADMHGDGFALDHLFGRLAWPRRLGMRLALAPTTMRALRHVGYPRLLARGLADTVRTSPALVTMAFAAPVHAPKPTSGPSRGQTPGPGHGPAPEFDHPPTPETGRGPAPGSARAAGPEALVGAGGRVVEYWLGATRAGLALHPVSVVLQHDDLRTRLEDRLRSPGRLFFVSRVGRPTRPFPPAPRREAALHLRTL